MMITTTTYRLGADMNREEANYMKLEIWQQIMRVNQPPDPIRAATAAVKTFNELFPPSVKVVTSMAKRRAK